VSINFCTLTSETVSSFCGIQRAKIFARLVPLLHPPVPTNVIGGNRINRQYEHNSYPDNDTHLTFEQPFIIVSAELFGIMGMEKYEVFDELNFVSITDFEILSNTLNVNITDFEIL
jgi:hypothetical protein